MDPNHWNETISDIIYKFDPACWELFWSAPSSSMAKKLSEAKGAHPLYILYNLWPWPPFHWLPSPPIVCFCCLCLFLWCVCCLRFLFGWLLPLLRLFCLFIAPDQAVPLAPPHHPPLTVRRFSDDIGEVQFDAHLKHQCILQAWVNNSLPRYKMLGKKISLHLFQQLKD